MVQDALRPIPLAKPHLDRSLVWVNHPRRPKTPATKRFIDIINGEVSKAVEALNSIVKEQKVGTPRRKNCSGSPR